MFPVYLPGLTFGTGYGGASYAFSPYGSTSPSRPPSFVGGGYGGASYSYSSYGSLGGVAPRISSAISITGFVIRVFFSEEMLEDANITDPANYVLNESFGVPCTVTSVSVSSRGPDGVTSIDLFHTGTTLGGFYEIVASNLVSFAGTPLSIPNNRIFVYTLGDTTSYAANMGAEQGTVDLYFFDSLTRAQELLTEGEFSPGVDEPTSYEVTTDYPITPVVSAATQNTSNLSNVLLEVDYLTDTDYNMIAGPALAFDYDGSVLPEDDPNFSGSQLGTGSASVSPTGLFLSKSSGDQFGYSFGDISGKILPNSSYRVDFYFDTTGTTINPTPNNQTFARFSVSDGVVEINLLFRDISGTKLIEVVSGTYSTQIPCPWYNTSATLSVVRNQKGDFYSVLCNGRPEVTFATGSANGAPIYGAGCAFTLTSDFNVNLFKISDIRFTSSQTLFTKQWNFLHSLITPFVGVGALTRNVIQTKRGPLVRGWGDNTIAKKEDVAVKINGTEVEVAGINPYIGEIYPKIPIPLAPAGTYTVDIDYIWFQNPSLPMLGLNTQGLNLNIWDRHDGHTHGSVSPTPPSSLGVVKTNRFPMGITLGPGERKSPKKIGHRYIGFQNDYSALLNQQDLLLLNKNPHSISDGFISAEALQQKGLFNGRVLPASADTPWTLSGIDNGALVGDGTYRLIDDSTGSYSHGFEGMYTRELDLSLPNITTQIARFKIESYVPDGVFTGVGFGVYDGQRLGLVGAVIIDGVQHFGLLLDGSNPHLAESWKIGFEYSAVAQTQKVIRVSYSGFPNGVEAGDRIRIANGPQVGVYTIEECGLNLVEDYVEITLKEELPANISITGNESFQIFFETKWDQDLCSFRIVIDYPSGKIDVNLASEVSGVFLSQQEIIPYPAQTALLILTGIKGAAFWGSISRKATNSSVWDIVQYLLSPEKILNTVQGINVQQDMNVLPQDDLLNPWYIISGFGDSSVSGGLLTLESNCSSTSNPTSFYYQSLEPYLTNKVEADVEARFRVTQENTSNSTEIRIRDGIREINLKTLKYIEVLSGRFLVYNATNSLSGLLVPEEEGWTAVTPYTVDASVTGQILTVTKTSSQNADWYQQQNTPPFLAEEGCVLRLDAKISNATSGSRGVGFSIGVSLNTPYTKAFNVTFDTGVIRIEDSFGATTWHTFTYNWEDDQFHKYKLTADPVADSISLMVDGVLIGSFLFSSIANPGTVFSNNLQFIGSGSCEVSINAFTMCTLRIPDAKRTFGIKVAGPRFSINSYIIPRTDGTGAPNSSLSAVPVEMDYTSFVDVRLLFNPTWGASFYRPDMNMPNGDPYVPGTTDPLNAWINVEYSNLPVIDVSQRGRGNITFGSVYYFAVCDQVWDYVNYRIRKPPSGFGIAPQGMVLNRAKKLTSGEFLFDKTLEDRTFKSRTSTLIYVPDCAIYADRVFKVIVDGLVIPASDYSFDKFTQYIVLSNPLPAEQYSVQVIFAVGQPISKTYLCDEPIHNSVTLLNEGTPPIPKNRIGSPPEPYLDVQFCTQEDGDSVNLSSICDGPGPGKGLAEIGIEGHFTTGAFEVPHGPGGVWGKSSPTIKGSSTHHALPIFHASGGNYTGPTLSPGSMMLYPNQQVSGGNTGMGINQDFTLRLETVTPYDDVLDIQSLMGDNVPPSTAEPIQSNPDGAPGTFNNGAVAYLQEDYGTAISRLGPWGGLSSLENSLLGGGSQLSGVEFTLQGGAQIARPVRTSGTLEAAS